MRIDRKFSIPLGILVALQFLDLIVHVATLQIEPIRITSNAVIITGAVAGVLSIGTKPRLAVVLTGAVYLILNSIFLVQHGAINPSTDALRLPFFVFVAGSLAVAYWISRRLQ